MWRSIQWRAGLTAAFLALSVIFLVPTLVDPLPKWWTKFLPTEKINLGLDLRGGMHLLLEVETQKAVDSALDKYASEMKDVLVKKEIPVRQVERTAEGKISVVLPDAKANDRFSQIRADHYGNFRVASFREQEGKFLYLLELNLKEAKSIEESAVRQGLETIRNRVDQFGVAEPVIVPRGIKKFLYSFPESRNPSERSS